MVNRSGTIGNDSRNLSANMQSVTMPCCKTTRSMHDDRNEFRRISCTRCGTMWYVRYIGDGKFYFKRHSPNVKNSENSGNSGRGPVR